LTVAGIKKYLRDFFEIEIKEICRHDVNAVVEGDFVHGLAIAVARIWISLLGLNSPA
jgi:hypothetical protein